MATYRKGQDLELRFVIPMRILRIFAVEDIIYYIVWIKGGNIKTAENKPLYAVFRHDDTEGAIPPAIIQMADDIVARENLLDNLG